MQLLERLGRESGREYALRTLTENIVNLNLAPGSQISENELAQQLGLSRTPVREALIELAKSRVVEIAPQKRTLVTPISYELVEEAAFIRRVLECAVVELACTMATSQDLAQLEETIQLQHFYLNGHSNQKLLELDDAFHAQLFQIAQKPQAFQLMKATSIHLDRIRRMSLESVKELKIVQDHQAILQALQQQDAQAARQAMELHLERFHWDELAIRSQFPAYF